MIAGDTIRVRGEGGAEWDQDVPEDGSVQRELLEDSIRAGRVQVLDDPHPEAVDHDTTPDTPDAVTRDLVAVLERLQALDHDAQTEVMDALDDRFADGVVIDLPVVPVPAAPEPGPVQKPNVRDGKDQWVTYAVAEGVPQADAEAMTKEALIDRFRDKET